MNTTSKIFLSLAIGTLLLGLFKNLFGQNGNNAKLNHPIRNGAFLVDVPTPQEFSEGYIKGAVNIPLNKIGSQLEKFKDKNYILVFCRSGN